MRPLLATLLCLVAFCGNSAAADEDRVTLRIRFGMKDQDPTDWSGKLVVGSGKVETIRGWRWMQNDSAEGNTWSVTHATQASAEFGRSEANRGRIAVANDR